MSMTVTGGRKSSFGYNIEELHGRYSMPAFDSHTAMGSAMFIDKKVVK